MTQGKQVSRTEIDCSTTVRADSIVPQLIKAEFESIENISESHIIGRHTRKAGGKVYATPRILLGPRLTSAIGCHCRIFKAHGSVTSQFWNLRDKDILVVVLLPT